MHHYKVRPASLVSLAKRVYVSSSSERRAAGPSGRVTPVSRPLASLLTRLGVWHVQATGKKPAKKATAVKKTPTKKAAPKKAAAAKPATSKAASKPAAAKVGQPHSIPGVCTVMRCLSYMLIHLCAERDALCPFLFSHQACSITALSQWHMYDKQAVGKLRDRVPAAVSVCMI